MSKTFQNRAEAFAYLSQNDPRAPKAGDPAPDFELSDINGGKPRAPLATMQRQTRCTHLRQLHMTALCPRGS